MPTKKSWGARGGNRLEDDALFREIGDQLTGLGGESFDYSQWQRTHMAKSPAKSVASQKEKPPPPPPKSVKRADSAQTGFTVSTTVPTLATSLRRIGSASSSCQHGARRKAVAKGDKEAELEDTRARARAERIKVLQLRIRARKQTLSDYRNRYFVLLDENIALKEGIDSEEGHNHDAVKKLLRKYEKFRGGIATINEKFVVEHARIKADLEKTKMKTKMDLEALREQVADVDEKLTTKQKELNVLMNYKDKEYPMKSLRIAELQKELVDVGVTNEGEIDELQHIVDSEMDKYRKERFKIHKDITVKVTNELTKQMDPSWEDLALHNMVMKKEIEFHRKEAEELEAVVRELERQVRGLLRDPKTSVRQQLFPHFYPTQPKCTPDMEVVLDIPTQEWLPI